LVIGPYRRRAESPLFSSVSFSPLFLIFSSSGGDPLNILSSPVPVPASRFPTLCCPASPLGQPFLVSVFLFPPPPPPPPPFITYLATISLPYPPPLLCTLSYSGLFLAFPVHLWSYLSLDYPRSRLVMKCLTLMNFFLLSFHLLFAIFSFFMSLRFWFALDCDLFHHQLAHPPFPSEHCFCLSCFYAGLALRPRSPSTMPPKRPCIVPFLRFPRNKLHPCEPSSSASSPPTAFPRCFAFHHPLPPNCMLPGLLPYAQAAFFGPLLIFIRRTPFFSLWHSFRCVAPVSLFLLPPLFPLLLFVSLHILDKPGSHPCRYQTMSLLKSLLSLFMARPSSRIGL